MARPYKLLEKMRRSKAGCSPVDLRHLYEGFGFVAMEGSRHTIYKHSKYPDLRATVARHTSLAIGYYSDAVKLVDKLLANEKAAETQEKKQQEKEENSDEP